MDGSKPSAIEVTINNNPNEHAPDYFSGDSLDMQVRTITGGYDQPKTSTEHPRKLQDSKNRISFGEIGSEEAGNGHTKIQTHTDNASHSAVHLVDYQHAASDRWKVAENDTLNTAGPVTHLYQGFTSQIEARAQCYPAVNDYPAILGTTRANCPQWEPVPPISWNDTSRSSDLLDSSQINMQYTSIGSQCYGAPFQLLPYSGGSVAATCGFVLPVQPTALPVPNSCYVDPALYGHSIQSNHAGNFLSEGSNYLGTGENGDRCESYDPGMGVNRNLSYPQHILEPSDSHAGTACGIGKILTDDLMHQVSF